MNSNLEDSMRHRVYPITKRISIGQFATNERAEYLKEQGYTHVLNVGEAPSVIRSATHGFVQVTDICIEDLALIPNDKAIQCLDTLRETLRSSDHRVFIHCIACQNRSPTVLWLYLLACGIGCQAAKRLITDRCPDAVPGHDVLVNEQLVARVQEHGRSWFQQLDPSTFEPAY